MTGIRRAEMVDIEKAMQKRLLQNDLAKLVALKSLLLAMLATSNLKIDDRLVVNQVIEELIDVSIKETSDLIDKVS
jgi:hypothetical protein